MLLLISSLLSFPLSPPTAHIKLIPNILGQVPGQPPPVDPIAAEQAAYVFSGPQYLIALVSGLLLAFAIQLLLTNFSVAAGISFLGRSSAGESSSSSVGSTIRKIGFGIGLWTLVTVSLALFIGCYLAVRLSNLIDPALGAIVALVIWAAYFCLLVWVSSTTVGSLIGSVVNTATSGFQAVLGTAAAALGGKAVNDQVVATAEAAAAAVRRELTGDVDPTRVRESVADYIRNLKPADLDLQQIRSGFESILVDPQWQSFVGPEGLQVDRQALVDLISSRSDLSSQDVNRIVDQLESVWQQTVGRRRPDSMGQLLSYLQSTQAGQIDVQEVNRKLDQVLSELHTLRQSGGESSSSRLLPTSLSSTLGPAMAMLVGRTDLSDLDVQGLLDKLKTAQSWATSWGEEASPSAVRLDVETYLLNTYSWQMTPERVKQDFRDLLYDPNANPRIVRQELEQFDRSQFVDLLRSRGLFTQAKIQEVATLLEQVRQEVIAQALVAEEQQEALALRAKVETYTHLTPKEQLQPEEMQRAFGALLEDVDASYDTLTQRLSPYTHDTFQRLLQRRPDLTDIEASTIAVEMVRIRDRVLFESQTLAEQARQRAEAAWTNVQNYLRNTGKSELNPDAIGREIQMLVHEPQLGAAALRDRAARFDRDTLVQLLSQRPDLSEAEAQDILDQVEHTWYRAIHAPQNLTAAAKEQYDKVTTSLAEYLRNTGKDELNPEGIRRDLNLLFNDPQAGLYALRDRLSEVDRDTLVQLLSQRHDLSEEQVNDIINQMQDTIRDIIKAPRRLALRAQQRMMSFEAAVEDYLRNTNKEELDPEGIKRDLSLLVSDPRLGLSQWGDRLSEIDRETVVALLAQRKDMTRAEAEEMVDRVLSVRDQILDQVRSLQARIQSVVDRIFEQIRNYLNSLERPELNYDGIRQDLRLLFDDPQAGFEALRARLSQVDRETLVALISSRPDISKSQADRLISQVEDARNSVLQQAERIQVETQRRIDELKQQAQKQAEETRKAAAIAAWWLFATALISAGSASLGGFMAVV
jgi:nucleoid DNA-binding protein